MADLAGNGGDPVAQLLDEFLAARRRGETVDIAAHAARAGDRAAELRELIDSAAMLEDLKGARPRGLPLHGPQVFGDYRLVAEIGRGGMGVVYEAEQITLQRRVALKVLPPQALRSESRLQRFKREAQTAAKLHHTNIVPIFGVGEQDGVHYFVMQLIVGRPLDEVIRALRGDPAASRPPSRARSGTLALTATSAAEALRAGTYAGKPPSGDVGPGDAAYYRSVASLGVQVADALAYAHAQGTLHRDIKPGNLILDAHGVLWITDFGLAKAMAGEAFTGSGDLVGTLQYMAPEQLGGQADERTDVHGLGLVLYELATLRPAFAAESKGELVERVKNQEPVSAARVRQGVPRDLDTIIAKAIAKEPSHRYASAAELRDDLERFLEDRPIRARPVSVIESGWRWCRRNRLLASVGAVAVLGLVSTAIASAVGYWSTRRALDRAVEATALAEANVAMALQGFEDLFASIVGPELLRADDEEEGDVVALEATRRISEDAERMLEKMLGTYDKLAAANRDNAAARQLTARAYHRVGEILRQLGKFGEAITNYERAVALYLELVGNGGIAPGVWMQAQNGLCRALWESARADFRRGERPGADDEQARASVRRAQSLAEAIIAYDPSEQAPLVRFERARAHDLLGINRGSGRGGPGTRRGRDQGRGPDPVPDGTRGPADATDHHRKALALNQSLLQEEPDNAVYRQATARSRYLLAAALRRAVRNESDRDETALARKREESATLQQQAIAALEALIAQDGRGSYRVDLCQALAITLRPPMGRYGVYSVRPSDAEMGMLRRLVDLWEGLARDFPGNTRYLDTALLWTLSLAGALSAPEAGRPPSTVSAASLAEAQAARRRALDVAEKLSAMRPGEVGHAVRLADVRRRVARDLLAVDRDAAMVLYRQAKADLDQAVAHDPSQVVWLADARRRVAMDLLPADRDAAMALYHQAKTDLDRAAVHDPSVRGFAGRLRLQAAQQLLQSGLRQEARTELDEAATCIDSLDDKALQWRAMQQLVENIAETYGHLGEPARADAMRKHLVPDSTRGGSRREPRDGQGR